MSPYLRVRLVADRLIAAVVLAAVSPVVAVLGWLVHRHHRRHRRQHDRRYQAVGHEADPQVGDRKSVV